MSFANASWMPEMIRFPLASGMITVIGTLTIFLAGILTANVISRIRRTA